METFDGVTLPEIIEKYLLRARCFVIGFKRRDNRGGRDMCWKVEVIVDDSGEWEGDPLRFETEQEALAYARDLEFRWSAVREKRIVKSEDRAIGC
jgi:hypothetical protein